MRHNDVSCQLATYLAMVYLRSPRPEPWKLCSARVAINLVWHTMLMGHTANLTGKGLGSKKDVILL